MAQTVRRNTKGVRRQARAQGTSRKVHKARSTGKSLVGQLLGMLPFNEDQLHKAFTVLILAGVAALVVFLSEISGATAVLSDRFAHVTANAGFKLVHVEPRGVKRMNEMAIYEKAFSQKNLAMTRVDVNGLRDDLLTMPWVKDARVSRQLPNVLVIDIIERDPHAVLKRADRLMLIDPTGVELETVSAEKAEEMLLIEGAGAQGQVEALSRLLDAAPALRQSVSGAAWVGNRRWDLTFLTGQRLALPEGEDRAAAALISFARADGVHRLIGGKIVAFDLRNPPRMYMREPGRAERQEMNMGKDG